MTALSLFCHPRFQRLLASGAIMLALAQVSSAQVRLPGSDYIYPVRVLTPDAPATAKQGKVRPDAPAIAKEGELTADDPTAAIKHKLDSIIFPSLEFKGVTVHEAIEQIRREAARLDPDPNPDTRGVNVFLKQPPVPPANVESAAASPGVANPPAASARITLNLTRLSLLDTLRYVAMQAGLTVKIEPYAVALVSVSEAEEALITQAFKVQLATLKIPAAPAEGDGQAPRRDMKGWLESQGVSFPAGASATYLFATQKLIVRNTSANIDLIAAILTPSSTQP